MPELIVVLMLWYGEQSAAVPMPSEMTCYQMLVGIKEIEAKCVFTRVIDGNEPLPDWPRRCKKAVLVSAGRADCVELKPGRRYWWN